MKLSYSCSIALTALFTASATAFAPTNSIHSRPSFITNESTSSTSTSTTSTTSTLSMAGFGGGGGMSKKKGKPTKTATSSTPILKPKAQWDRYGNLKKDNGIRVATRVVTDDPDGEQVQPLTSAGEWYEVGKIKSEGDAFTEIAVTLQRGIIAEHAKRLYPLQFLPKDKVEWAYASTPTPEQEDWIFVDKSAMSDVPAGVEKIIGFEGKPDPATGFYCNYKGGRLVDKYDVDKTLAKE